MYKRQGVVCPVLKIHLWNHEWDMFIKGPYGTIGKECINTGYKEAEGSLKKSIDFQVTDNHHTDPGEKDRIKRIGIIRRQ